MTTLLASGTQSLQIATREEPFVLQNGARIGPVHIAYETFGTLNADQSNAVLLFHALSGNQHASGLDPVGARDVPGMWDGLRRLWTKECQTGWWEAYVGPGKALDTNKHFVVCCNYLGGCYGSTGPASLEPGTESADWPNGRPYGRRFPFPSISDVVNTQVRVLDHLGIRQLKAAVGASLGGFCVLDLAARYPDRVRRVINIGSGCAATVLAKAMNFEQIYAIAEDARFLGGDYYGVREADFSRENTPWRGLALARMIAHKTFVSLRYLESRARTSIIQPTDVLAGYLLEHQVESYLLHKGKSFVERFDANCYLRIVNMWQSFDLPRQIAGGDVVATFAPCCDQKWLVFTISSDACFYPEEQADMVRALKANRIEHQYITVNSDKGHDSFLLEPELFSPHIHFMLND